MADLNTRGSDEPVASVHFSTSPEGFRRFSEATTRQARLYEMALSGTLDLLYVFDLEGRFTYANPGLLAVLGKRAEDVLGKNFFDLAYPPLLAQRLADQITTVIVTGQPLRDETPFTGTAGPRRYEYIFTAAFDEEGFVEAVAGVTRDITERIAAEEALREADQRKDEFLAMLAHELRNPLASVRNAVTLLKEAGAESQQAWAADVIERQTRQLSRLVDDLLDISRINHGKIELQCEHLDAAQFLEAACDSVAPLIAARDHLLRAIIPRGELWLHGDPTRLQQIVVNLLANAARYTEPQGRLWLEAAQLGEEIVIEVRDSGIGIPPEKIPKMFELFAQGERTAARSEGGLGLGLTIVRGLCQLHGGSVSAHSEGKGKGSTFIVRLPAVPKPAQPVPALRPHSGPNEGAGRQILVVDDNEDAAAGLGRLLTRRGYAVRLAATGPEALDAVEALAPAAILLDIGLPGMDGFEVAARLRQDPRCGGLVIIALSGYGQEEDRARSAQAGFDSHLVKPVDFEEVRGLLRAALGKS
ncbi:MAG TPA: ATP-binding protein [Chthoniobacteraceae bacterium]|jgi:PAS domain S-box-containing protein|nr:ATP-binding protein [Chthoniobacteraceae bacterium]